LRSQTRGRRAEAPIDWTDSIRGKAMRRPDAPVNSADRPPLTSYSMKPPLTSRFAPVT
jgi:hypothetical protein